MSSSQPIILYHYDGSPYSDRVLIYLALKRIAFNSCVQPPMLPRPDLAALGVKHRRIPILSIGRDIYLDSRLITDKLGGLLPAAQGTPEHNAISRLLKTWTTGPELFMSAAMLLPLDNPRVNNPAFQKDRADLVGRADVFPKEARAVARPEALIKIRHYVEFLETTLLSDGRQWILGNGEATAADVDAIWILRWVNGMPGAFEEAKINKDTFPKVLAWIERFNKMISQIQGESSGKPDSITGEQAAQMTLGASYQDTEVSFDAEDPVVKAQGFSKGQNVQLWPSDYGSLHKDEGKLVGLTRNQITIETETASGSTVRIHAPRLGFRIKAVSQPKM